MLFYLVGTIISIAGFISGIVVGSKTDNFGFCALVWLSAFLYAIIYFGIGLILSKVDALNEKIVSPNNNNTTYNTNNTTTETERIDFTKNTQTKNSKKSTWTCHKCGITNSDNKSKCSICGAQRIPTE